MNTMKAVRFDEYGGTSVLEVRDVPDRAPERGQVRVKVAYAGINPGEAVIREGVMKEYFPARFPGEGQGSDFSGVVVGAGPGVTGVHVGQGVIGMSDERSAQAEFVTIDRDRVVPLPDGVDPAVGNAGRMGNANGIASKVIAIHRDVERAGGDLHASRFAKSVAKPPRQRDPPSRNSEKDEALGSFVAL